MGDGDRKSWDPRALRNCALIIRRGAVKREGVQCRLPALGRVVTCKFLVKWGWGKGK